MLYPIFTSNITNLFSKFVGAVMSGAIPPDFTDDLVNPSTLLSYWDGANATPTTKTDKINGWNMVAVEGPCLTLAVGDTMYLPLDDDIVSNGGTGTATYDGTNATVTVAGTFFNMVSRDGLIFPFCEGSGTEVRDITGKNKAVITAVGEATMWDATQDSYFYAMETGWYKTDPDNGVQYPYNPETKPWWSLSFVITGLGKLTIEGVDYLAGTHIIEGLIGTVAIVAEYGAGEEIIILGGDTLQGAYPNYTIDMFSPKTISVDYDSTKTLNIEVIGASTATIEGIPYTVGTYAITGLYGLTNIDMTYGGTDNKTDFTGVDGADVTGTDPNFVIDMTADKTITATAYEFIPVNLLLNGDFSDGTNNIVLDPGVTLVVNANIEGEFTTAVGSTYQYIKFLTSETLLAGNTYKLTMDLIQLHRISDLGYATGFIWIDASVSTGEINSNLIGTTVTLTTTMSLDQTEIVVRHDTEDAFLVIDNVILEVA